MSINGMSRGPVVKPRKPAPGDVVQVNGMKCIIDQVGSKYVTLLEFASKRKLGMYPIQNVIMTGERANGSK